MQKPLTYSLQQVANMLGVTAVTVARRADAGEVPTITLGRRRLVPRAYVEGLFAEAGYPLLEANEEAASA